ncbi:MAG: VOC family protein [Opitutaceae bacterium]
MASSTPYPTLCASIAANDAERALEFYVRIFGAKERYRLIDPESGRVGHAELSLGDSVLMIADEYPAYNKTPKTLGGTTAKLCLMVDDVDATVKRATEAGATVVMPPTDMFYGFRTAAVRDPFGHEWSLQRQFEEVSPEEMARRWKESVESGKSE